MVMRHKRAVTHFQKAWPAEEATNIHMWAMQNKLRQMATIAALGSINWAILRRLLLPQVGVLVSGAWRSLCVDLAPGLLYLNFQFNIGMVKYAQAINRLDPYGSDSSAWLTGLRRQYAEESTERKVNKQFYADSQYWH